MITENDVSYIALTDSNGELKPHLKAYVGYDIDRDGTIGEGDITTIKALNSLQAL